MPPSGRSRRLPLKANVDVMSEEPAPTPQPKWFTLGGSLLWPLAGMAASACRANKLSTPDLSTLGELAVFHHAACLEASISINRRGKHSVAIAHVRQSVEALSIAEVALQEPQFAEPLLASWKDGKKSGEVRRALEQSVWPRYGNGLWSEPWSDFYANLARAVQAYAHYTSELQVGSLSNTQVPAVPPSSPSSGSRPTTPSRPHASLCSTCCSHGCSVEFLSRTANTNPRWRGTKTSSGSAQRFQSRSYCSKEAIGALSWRHTCGSNRGTVGAMTSNPSLPPTYSSRLRRLLPAGELQG